VADRSGTALVDHPGQGLGDVLDRSLGLGVIGVVDRDVPPWLANIIAIRLPSVPPPITATGRSLISSKLYE
jgi:hypothetical protein